MKKQIFALILLSILVLALITGCTQKISGDGGNTSADGDGTEPGDGVLDTLGDDLIDENESVELGELI